MRYSRLGYVLVLALMVFACRAAAAAPVPAAAPAAPAAEAAPKELLEMADQAAKEVETLRGWKFKEPVQKKVCTPEFVRAYLDKQVEKQCPPAKVLEIQAFLRTVGLLPPAADLKKMFLDILQGQVGGFYDTDTKTLYMVKHGGAPAPGVERILMIHELVHALDDQHVNLDEFLKPLIGQTEDMDIAASSVMEGSATSLMTQYMTRALLAGQLNAAEMQAYTEGEAENTKALMDAPRYFTSILGSYICGMQFLAKGNILAVAMAPDNQAVGRNLQAVVKDPPKSSEQILHPEKYWDAGKRDDPVVVNDDAAARLLASPNRAVVHKNTVGEMLTAVLTAPKDSKPNLLLMQMADAWTNTAAKGWGGDRFFLLASGPSAEAAGKSLKDLQGVWITLWDTPKDRDEFADAFDANAASAHATFRLGNMAAVVFFGFDEAERKALEARFEKSPPPMTQSGKPWSPWSL
ncbi:MAG: hypothetical protein NTU94_15340 [Planctomycetota bacterium]|nr:hypothetical protein [Planctomycetota bacterium]